MLQSLGRQKILEGAKMLGGTNHLQDGYIHFKYLCLMPLGKKLISKSCIRNGGGLGGPLITLLGHGMALQPLNPRLLRRGFGPVIN